MQAAKLSAGLLATGGILGYGGSLLADGVFADSCGDRFVGRPHYLWFY